MTHHDTVRGLKEDQDDVDSPTREPMTKKTSVDSNLS